jgi:hypothetical protein
MPPGSCELKPGAEAGYLPGAVYPRFPPQVSRPLSVRLLPATDGVLIDAPCSSARRKEAIQHPDGQPVNPEPGSRSAGFQPIGATVRRARTENRFPGRRVRFAPESPWRTLAWDEVCNAAMTRRLGVRTCRGGCRGGQRRGRRRRCGLRYLGKRGARAVGSGVDLEGKIWARIVVNTQPEQPMDWRNYSRCRVKLAVLASAWRRLHLPGSDTLNLWVMRDQVHRHYPPEAPNWCRC